jgi:hypothetical protein
LGGTGGTQGREDKVYKVLVEIQKERDNWEDQSVDRKIRSDFILGRFSGGVYSGSRLLRIGACE